MSRVISVSGLSKAYQLGEVGTGTLSRDLERFWARMRGKPDPFIKIGEENDKGTKGASNVVWSLKDIEFDIAAGDAVGIIGRNGAGKSTLLKILSRVTAPTMGSAKVKGRIASLLEVGTGFHPELSGRENIYLNGAILGMRKNEIKRKFDQIVDFSGIERYVDTPVKRYSSGMYVRLAFAVAAHLESEILIVDEVLAVGDAEFQRKCLGKMGEVSKGEGRTVLFVSHNMAAIQRLCRSAMFLENGRLKEIGATSSIITRYLQAAANEEAIKDIELPADHESMPGYVSRVQVENMAGGPISEFPAGESWQVRIYFTLNRPLKDVIVGVGLSNEMEANLRTSWSLRTDYDEGQYQAVFQEKDLLLAAGTYKLVIGLSSSEATFHYVEDAVSFTILPLAADKLDKSIIRVSGSGMLLNPMSVNIMKR